MNREPESATFKLAWLHAPRLILPTTAAADILRNVSWLVREALVTEPWASVEVVVSDLRLALEAGQQRRVPDVPFS